LCGKGFVGTDRPAQPARHRHDRWLDTPVVQGKDWPVSVRLGGFSAPNHQRQREI
jgi:hypothetical protein